MTIVIICVLIFIVLLVFIQYNTLTKLKLEVEKSKSGIDVYLQQRFDLIPNLVNVVKTYAKYEDETIEKIIELRTKYNDTKNDKNSRL